MIDLRAKPETQLERQPGRKTGEKFQLKFYEEMNKDYETIYQRFKDLPSVTVHTDIPKYYTGTPRIIKEQNIIKEGIPNFDGQKAILTEFFGGLEQAGLWKGTLDYKPMLDEVFENVQQNNIDLRYYQSQS